MNNTTKSKPWVCSYPAERGTSTAYGETPVKPFVQSLEFSATGGLMAAALYAFTTTIDGGTPLLSALAGTSALVYLELLLEGPTWARRVITLTAMPAIFTTAYLSLNGPVVMLSAAFMLHTIVTASQLRSQDRSRDGLLWFWLTFNAVLAVMVAL